MMMKTFRICGGLVWGLLVLSASAEIIYSTIPVDFPGSRNTNFSVFDETYYQDIEIDMNGDGIVELIVDRPGGIYGDYGRYGGGYSLIPTNGARVMVRHPEREAHEDPFIPLEVGYRIDASGVWSSNTQSLYITSACGGHTNDFPRWNCTLNAPQGPYLEGGFIGVEFLVGTNTHYGWYEMSGVRGLFLDQAVAYEDQPDTAITVIPEPGSVVMWLGGAGLLTLYRRERARCRKHPDDVR